MNRQDYYDESSRLLFSSHTAWNYTLRTSLVSNVSVYREFHLSRQQKVILGRQGLVWADISPIETRSYADRQKKTRNRSHVPMTWCKIEMKAVTFFKAKRWPKRWHEKRWMAWGVAWGGRWWLSGVEERNDQLKMKTSPFNNKALFRWDQVFFCIIMHFEDVYHHSPYTSRYKHAENAWTYQVMNCYISLFITEVQKVEIDWQTSKKQK